MVWATAMVLVWATALAMAMVLATATVWAVVWAEDTGGKYRHRHRLHQQHRPLILSHTSSDLF